MWVVESADGGLRLRFRERPETASAAAIVAAPRKEASFLPPNLIAPKKRRSFCRFKNLMKNPTPAADSLSSTLTDHDDDDEERQGSSSNFSSGMGPHQSLNLDLVSHKEPDWTRLDEEQGSISGSSGMVIETLLHFKPESDNKPVDWSGMFLLADVVDSTSDSLQRGNTTAGTVSSISILGGLGKVNQKGSDQQPLCTEQVLKDLILFESTKKNCPQFGWPYLKLPKKSRQQRKKRLQFGVAFIMKIRGKKTTAGNIGLKRGLESGIGEENERISKKPRIHNKVKPVVETLRELVLQKKHFLNSPAKNANPNLLLCTAY